MSWIELAGAEGTQPGLCFFELDDAGLIARTADRVGWKTGFGVTRAGVVAARCVGEPLHDEFDWADVFAAVS